MADPIEVALAMIVRDEQATIGRCIESCRGLADHVFVVGTGPMASGDHSLALAHEASGKIGATCVTTARDWRDFGHNRSELLQVVGGYIPAGWTLLLDADMTVEGRMPTVEEADGIDGFLLRYEGDPSYWQTLLVRKPGKWRYVGVTHEYIEREGARIERWPHLRVTHHMDGAHRPQKFERDRELLEAACYQNPNDSRALFYLAQTYRDIAAVNGDVGLTNLAATTYIQRARMGGWDEEVYYSWLQAGVLSDSIEHLMRAAEFRPQRAEAWYELAWRFRVAGLWMAALWAGGQAPGDDVDTTDVLFVSQWVIDFALDFEEALAREALGERAKAQASFEWVLASNAPEVYKQACIDGLARLA